MNRKKLGWAILTGLLVGVWAGIAASPQESYSKVDAASLVKSPQNSWARAIIFTDVLTAGPSGKTQRMDRKDYMSMKLQTAGTVWVPMALVPKFQELAVGSTYSFAGTVDQIARRYYVIVDACYQIQTTADMKEQWTDMLNPSPDQITLDAELSDSLLQSLLVEAQNSLIKMARENNVSVAQLIEAQADGGQRIAANIVTDTLRGELRAKNQTAEELMVGAVLALLQKQAVLEESARIAEENLAAEAEEQASAVAMEEAAPIEPEEEEPVQEVAAVLPEAEEELAQVEEPLEIPEPLPEELATDWTEEIPLLADAQEVELEPTAEAIAAAIIEEESSEIAPAEPTVKEKAKKSKKKKKKPAEEIVPDATEELTDFGTEFAEEELGTSTGDVAVEEIEFSPGPTQEEEIAAAEEIPAEPVAVAHAGSPVAPPPSSMLVGPLTQEQPGIVPQVSMQPTRAERKAQKRQEALEKREQKLAARKAQEEEKARQLEAARQQALIAKEEALAKREAAKAEKARKKEEAKQKAIAAAEERARQAEANRLAKEEAARQALEAKQLAAAEKKAAAEAKKAKALAEAEAKQKLAAEAQRVQQAQREAEARMRETEAREKQAEAARIQREEIEKRLADIAARVQAEKEKQAEELRIAQEVAAAEEQAAAEAAERIAAETQARQEAEAKLAQVQAELRQLEAQARAEEKAPSAAILPEEPQLSPREQRRLLAAQRKAERLAQEEAIAAEKAAAKAAAKTRAAEKKQPVTPAVPTEELPEWMQPVMF